MLDGILDVAEYHHKFAEQGFFPGAIAEIVADRLDNGLLVVLDHPGQGAQVLHACLIVGHRVCQIGLALPGEGRVQVILGRIVVGGEWRVHRSAPACSLVVGEGLALSLAMMPCRSPLPSRDELEPGRGAEKWTRRTLAARA